MKAKGLPSGKVKLGGYAQGVLNPLTGEYLWRCPRCAETIRLCNEVAVRLAEWAGGCQGCRAKAAFERNPGLVGFFVDFWSRACAWPQSDSWMKAVRGGGISILANAGA
jgi:hypothetical protein